MADRFGRGHVSYLEAAGPPTPGTTPASDETILTVIADIGYNVGRMPGWLSCRAPYAEHRSGILGPRLPPAATGRDHDICVLTRICECTGKDEGRHAVENGVGRPCGRACSRFGASLLPC